MADTGTITDPQSITIGSVSLTGVLSISYNKSSNFVQARAADAQTRQGAPYLASEGGYGGTITFENPNLAQTFERISGTMSGTGKGVGSAADATFAITNVVTGSVGASVNKDASASATLPFAFGSADGTTDPISWT